MTDNQKITACIMAIISGVILCMSGCKYNPEVRYEFEDKEGAKEYVGKIYNQKISDYNKAGYAAGSGTLDSFWIDSTEKAREFYTTKEILIDDRSVEVESNKVFMRESVFWMWVFWITYILSNPAIRSYLIYVNTKRKLHLVQSERLSDPNYNPMDN